MVFFRHAAVILVALLAAFQVHALNILLTNDDGYEHPWIRAVYSSLVEAGHQVTMAAPAIDQSGQSAALTLSKAQIDNPEPGIYAVHATPASAVLTGLSGIMDERPDLVVSGTNEGANIGVLSSFSGTVGAVVAALHLAGESIPGIAISGNLIDTEGDVHSEANLAHGRQIADFLARLVEHLEDSQDERGGLLPPGIALNVNYPIVSPDQIKGVGVYRHGHNLSSLFSLSEASEKQSQLADDTFLSSIQQGHEPSALDGDIAALRDGYITIVPIDGDYTAQGWQEIFPEQFFESIFLD